MAARRRLGCRHFLSRRSKSQHLWFGEFSSKFAECTRAAPFLDDPEVLVAEPGTYPGRFPTRPWTRTA